MSVFDPLTGGSVGDGPDHEHDILLIAGSRPEVARLAPVASAIAAADRICGITVATGPDPMAVHEAFEALGVPTDITILLPADAGPGMADVAAALFTRLDRLLVDQEPVEPGEEGGRDVGHARARVGGQQDRDVGRHAERLERLVHGHRIGTGGDGDPADPVRGGDGGRDRCQPGDLGAAPRDQEDVVFMIRPVTDRAARQRVEHAHRGPFRSGS